MCIRDRTGTWLRGQRQGWRRASHAAREEPLRAGPTPRELVPHHRPHIGFVRLKSDTCVYVYNHEGVKIISTLYVDDLLLAGINAEAMAIVKSQLKQRFKMTDMGEASLMLGIGIKRGRLLGTLTISQEAYSKSILCLLYTSPSPRDS